MAFDLVARLSVKDAFSRNMRRFQKQTELVGKAVKQSQRSTDDWTQSTNKLSNRLNRLSNDSKRAFQGMTRGADAGRLTVGKLTGAFVALGAAIGGVKAAKGIFDKTIGAAAQMELSNIQIKAMFRDDGKASKYVKDMESFAANSPVMNSQDIFSNSKSFIALSKSNDELTKMWKLSEKLVAMDPRQGVEGAVLALRELFSGDSVSLVDRFELDRKTLNQIKNLPLNKQLDQLDKYFNKLGFTADYINEIGGATTSLWTQIQEKMALMWRDMGNPALKRIRDFLTKVNTQMANGSTSGVSAWGGKVLDGLAATFIKASTSVGNWIQGLMNNQEFQKKTTLGAKVTFIFDNLYAKFAEWRQNGGQEVLNNISIKLVDGLATAIEAATPRIAKVAVGLGKAIGSAAWKGINNYVSTNWKTLLSYLMGGYFFGDDYDRKLNPEKRKKSKGSYASGLSYVRPQSTVATLHHGERVLTAEENRQYSNGGGGKPVTINVAKMEVRKESDIDDIAWKLVKYLQEYA